MWCNNNSWKKGQIFTWPRCNFQVNEWISNDKALTQITAERYILDYLRVKNTNFIDKFTGGGVDAFLTNDNSRVGIESNYRQSVSSWMDTSRKAVNVFSKK